VHIPRVAIAGALAAMADLHHELPGPGELQDLVVLVAAARDPHEFLVVYVNPMLRAGPLIAIARASPGLDEISGRVELEYRGASHALLFRLHGTGTVDDPNVILLGIDSYTRNQSKHPFGRNLWPSRIHLENWYLGVLAIDD